MAEKTFTCSVVTPERVVLECDARFVALPAWDGEIGILRHRAPLVVKLGIGRLRVQTAGEVLVFFIAGGFAQMVDNQLTVLTEEALRPAEIEREEAEKAMFNARTMTVTDEASFVARQEAMQRARVQLHLTD